MKLPTTQAINLIESANFSWIDHLYGGSIPKEVQENVDSTDVVVIESINQPSQHANDQFKKWQIGVEVLIFYQMIIPTGFSTMKAEIDLAKWFKTHGWSLTQSRNHITDPDTNQVSKVFYFEKGITLKEDE